MLVRFIGDPKQNGSGPARLEMCGYNFVLNGEPTRIDLPSNPTAKQRSNFEVAKRVFARHTHFQVVTPALLRKEAEEAAKLAAEAAELAKAEAAKAMEETGDGTDEVSVDDEGSAVPGRPRGRRRG